MRQPSEVRALNERIGYLEAEIERLREEEHALRGRLASRLPIDHFHLLLDKRGVPRANDEREMFLSERLDWLAEKREG